MMMMIMMFNSATDCSISFRLASEFDHITADKQQTFKVKCLKVKVTTWRNVSAVTRNSASADIERVGGHNYSVQGHSRSLMLVPSERPYATFC